MKGILKEAALICLVAGLLGVITWAIHPRAPVYGAIELAEGEITLSIILAEGAEVLWVDARSRDTYERDHVPGAILLNEDDWETLLNEFLDSWNPDLTIVVYCDSQQCQASKHVAERLRSELQLEKVYTLYGGWETWLKHRKR